MATSNAWTNHRLQKHKQHTIELIIDRYAMKTAKADAQTIEEATKQANGLVRIEHAVNEHITLSNILLLTTMNLILAS